MFCPRGERHLKVCWYRDKIAFVVLSKFFQEAEKARIAFSSHVLILRSSSFTLTMAQPVDIIERVSDDMSIAQGLLGAPIIPPRRRTSFTSTSKSVYTRDDSSELEESTSINDETRRRQMVQSSNTWTASSGEILSDKDDVEDRTFFILEYNRLATKVGRKSAN